jgi:hypothetical protein
MTQIDRSTVSYTAWRRENAGFGLAFGTVGVLVVTFLAAMVLVAAEASVPADVRLSTQEAMSSITNGTISPYELHVATDVSKLPVEEIVDPN